MEKHCALCKPGSFSRVYICHKGVLWGLDRVIQDWKRDEHLSQSNLPGNQWHNRWLRGWSNYDVYTKLRVLFFFSFTKFPRVFQESDIIIDICSVYNPGTFCLKYWNIKKNITQQMWNTLQGIRTQWLEGTVTAVLGAFKLSSPPVCYYSPFTGWHTLVTQKESCELFQMPSISGKGCLCCLTVKVFIVLQPWRCTLKEIMLV